MSNNEFVIKHLITERTRLIGAKEQSIREFDEKIREVEAAIETLAGKTVWTFTPDELYDDESPDYIKSSSIED